jgi:23S rRNA (adenine2503-C2)-methyltransferase
MTLSAHCVLESKRHDTFKAILETYDKKRIESVLMQNARGHWTLCVSSQVGCAMNCSFCATGKMGFTRNLTSDEIIDQYRFFLYFLQNRATQKRGRENLDADQGRCEKRSQGVYRNTPTSTTASDAEMRQIIVPQITNIVYMGMGEPLANYENVKSSLNTILQNTDIGHTRITVSTVGVLPKMQKLLTDPEWPDVRIAISLHSADPTIRKNIVPSTANEFFDTLAKWMKNAYAKNPTRRNHITFEYILIENVNERKEDAKKLIQFAQNADVPIKINLIPYNKTLGNPFSQNAIERQGAFQKMLDYAGITATIRRPMGDDISAACGQLISAQGTGYR